MSSQWQHQIRLDLADTVAEMARRNLRDPVLKSLAQVLDRHGATLKCQFDAFADYVAEAERNGIDKYPLYAWTKATIERPEKKAKYVRSFTVYVNGDEVYDRAAADALEADLRPLVGGPLVMRLARHDTNPANNPQPPAQFRR